MRPLVLLLLMAIVVFAAPPAQDSHHLDFPDVARKNRDVGGGTERTNALLEQMLEQSKKNGKTLDDICIRILRKF
ncbi:hypothetical protein PRIPAC_81522 [Pristionchus pacificus]|uniref:Uncharacterized protein n=1 Tax=Pristionchus pacificus TaxID=54126 RepID=A0A454Y4N2_PRIPA|nr:hypothetical protein PRIPAC_81522 [Pristionchus pacificus]|eukprot:PDM65276.1 hypothetical protein PRIPAC_52218 [Pristionchus pacificus]